MNLPPAKNVVLAGVKSVTLYDPEPVQLEDLGTQVRCDLPRFLFLVILTSVA